MNLHKCVKLVELEKWHNFTTANLNNNFNSVTLMKTEVFAENFMNNCQKRRWPLMLKIAKLRLNSHIKGYMKYYLNCIVVVIYFCIIIF